VKATIHHLTWGVFKKFKNENAHCLLASFESQDRAEDCANRIHEECQEDEFFESVDVLPLEVEPPTLTPEVRALIQALRDTLQYCVTPKGLPDKGKGRTDEQQRALDAALAALAPFAESSPEPLRPEITDEDRILHFDDWQYDVRNGDTRLGLDDWILHQKESEEFSATPGE
jgi:hypothetical protein